MRWAAAAVGVLLVAACASTPPAPVVSTPGTSAAAVSASPTTVKPTPSRSSAAPTTSRTEDLAVPAAAADYPWPSDGQGGCEAPSWPGTSADAPAPGRGRRVLVIGDSLVREVSLQSGAGTPTSPALKAALTAAGWTPTVVCWKGRTTEWALEQVRELGSRGLLPPRVVIAMGTNDLWVDAASPAEFEARASRVLDALAQSTSTDGGPPRVWWVNLWVDTAMAAWNHEREPRDPDMAGYEAYNTALQQACTPAVNCTVIDWHAVVTADPSLAARAVESDLDGVHLSKAGSQARARVIVGKIR